MVFSVSRDWNGGILEQVLRSNLRIPRDTIGDINAQLVANETGRRRVHALIERYGYDTFMEICEEFLDYAEKVMRAALEEIPDGVYYGECMADDDGIHDEPPVIKAKVTVEGSEVWVDFTGTGDNGDQLPLLLHGFRHLYHAENDYDRPLLPHQRRLLPAGAHLRPEGVPAEPQGICPGGRKKRYHYACIPGSVEGL